LMISFEFMISLSCMILACRLFIWIGDFIWIDYFIWIWWSLLVACSFELMIYAARGLVWRCPQESLVQAAAEPAGCMLDLIYQILDKGP
jgi:hypothetical protein